MVRNNYTLLFFLLMAYTGFAQNHQQKYIVYFKDKPLCENVSELFSEKALAKRQQFNIAFDEKDYPVSASYIKQLKDQSIAVVNQSNWLNAALVMADEVQLKNLSFISHYLKIEKTDNSSIASIANANECEEIQDYEDNYTSSFPQFHLLNGEYLHEQGFNGEDMTIAVCDNGFYNANNNPGFSHIFNDNRILGTYDFVHGDSLVYDESNGVHGSNCFSFIGGLKENQYIGTATKSSFYLFHTEDNSGERLQEEFNLAAALERCTQLGVDVVSISLGYFIFDNEQQNNFDTIDTKTNNTPAAKAVNTASSKGLLVCVAAGNSNNGAWVTSPACADSALAIASVNINGAYGGSSVGIPGDPRIKPNVAAVGVSCNYLNTIGNIATGGGTSYATPSLAGMAACLWQAFPAKTNWEIKTVIEQSASQYLTPDKKIGYGIPDFKKAYDLLLNPTFVSNKELENEFLVFPNPFQHSLTISNLGTSHIDKINVMNNIGQVVASVNSPAQTTIELGNLTNGMYLVEVSTSKGVLIKKLIKE